MTLKPEEIPQQLFALDPNIRYVGVLNETKSLAVSKMRPGVKSVTSDDDDRYFMNVIPTVVLGAFQRLAKYAGELAIVTAQYEKISLMLFHVGGYAVVASAETKALDAVLSKLHDWRGKAQ